MYLYVLVFKDEPIIKIGICINFTRLKSLRNIYPLDLENSYYCYEANPHIIKNLEEYILSKTYKHKVNEAYSRKYSLGISYFSPEGWTELRSKDCLPIVLKIITNDVPEYFETKIELEKGIVIPNFKGKRVLNPSKMICPDEIWYNELDCQIKGVLLWLQNPDDNPIAITSGVHGMGTFQDEDYTTRFYIYCDTITSMQIIKIMQLWIRPNLSINLVDFVHEFIDGTSALSGLTTPKDILRRYDLNETFSHGKWRKKVESIFSKLNHALGSSIYSSNKWAPIQDNRLPDRINDQRLFRLRDLFGFRVRH